MKPSLLNISKTMAFATAIGAASAAWATVFPGSTDFENEAVPDTTYTEGSAVISQIETPPDVASRPAHYPYESSRTNVLEIDTGADAPVFRNLNAAGTAEEGTIYVDMLVKPTAIFAPDASPTPGSTDKLLVYFKEYPAGTTNLCVYAGYDNDGLTKGECFLSSQLPVDKDTWYRLVIEAKTLQEAYPGFNVYLGGYGSDFLCKRNEDPDFYSLLIDLNNTENPLPSAVAKVGFAGSGFVDDFVASDIDPDAVVTVPFTLTWPSGLTAVSYQIDAETPVSLTGETSPYTINDVTNGTVVTFIVSNGDGAQKTLTVTAAEGTVVGIDATGATFGWADYLGAAVDGAYTIDDANDLNMLRKGVAAGLVTSNETFKQTANIDMTSAPAFAGIGVGAENEATLSSIAFCGIYDGNNKTISNITFTNRKGSGLFNLIRHATIKDLTVDTVSYEGPFANAKEGGAMIVGNGVDCTLQHLVTLGSNGLNNPCTYNAAGIANRLEGRGGPVLVIGCTNNAAIYGCYSKLGGICPIVQGADQTVTFVDCANTGDIVANGTTEQTTLSGKTPGVDGAAGILGYAQGGGSNYLSFTNCVNTGTITGVSGTKVASIFGYCNNTTTGVKIVGGSAQADVLSINDGAANVTGAKFATVDNGVATFVADDALALNGEYKVMAGSATATFVFTDLGTISFDEALSTPTYAITSSGAAGIPVASTSGTVTTYTAGYFPRTATAGQDGTAANPYEIADVDDLQALAAYTAGQSLCYVQVANIDMTSAGTFPGIGGDFTGTYDGGNYTISNIEFAANTYRGLFNKVTGATIKNLKIDTVTFAAAASGVEFGGSAFVGKVYGNTVLSNLTAKGSVGSALAPANHSIAGVATRVYGQNVKFFDCANEASVYGEVRKVAGVLGIIQGTASVDFIGCSNSGAIVTTTVTHHDIGDNKDYTTGADGLAGIIAYANAPTTLKDCVNTGAIQINSGNTGASVGELIGKCGSTTITDLGGNKGASDKKMIGTRAGTITGFQYATVESSVATTIASPYTVAAGNTYLLEGNATPVVELADGESIAFNTALGYTLTDTGITAAEGLTLTDETVGTVKTYTATTSAPSIPDWATDVTGESVIDQAVSDKYATWAANVAGLGADLTQDCSAQFLMNVPADASVILQIESINVTDEGTQILIGATANGSTEINMAGINGILNVMVAAELGSWTKKSIPAANLEFVNNKAEVLIPATDGRFVKASVDYTKGGNSLTPVSGSGE